MVIDISKKLFFILFVFVTVVLLIFSYWIYNNTKTTVYDFELVYLREADFKFMKADNVSCFAETNINGTKFYSCVIAKKIK